MRILRGKWVCGRGTLTECVNFLATRKLPTPDRINTWIREPGISEKSHANRRFFHEPFKNRGSLCSRLFPHKVNDIRQKSGIRILKVDG